MNSLLKIKTSAWRFLLASLVVVSVGVLFGASAEAGKTKANSQISDSNFQLTLSNKVYNGDPQSKFLRQSCEPGQHAKVSAKVSGGKTKMSSKRPATK